MSPTSRATWFTPISRARGIQRIMPEDARGHPYHPRVHRRPLVRRIPFLLFVGLAAFAIYSFGWRGGETSDEDRERAKARAWAQVLAVTGEDGLVASLERQAPYLWSVVIERASGVSCFELYVDPARTSDLPGFEHGTVAEVVCPRSGSEL
jgi:hypothetical protein